MRTWQPERDRRLVIVLDTSRVAAGRIGDVPRLDAAIDATLLLGALASRAGDRVDLVAGDQVVRARVRGGRGEGLLPALSDALAPLEPTLVEADWRLLTAQVAALARQRSLVVLCTPCDPAAVGEFLLPALAGLTRRHRVVLASVQDPDLVALASGVGAGTDGGDGQAPATDDGVYLAAAAEHALAARADVAGALARLGVDVVDRPPADLSRALADHYLGLKDRGLL